MSDIAVALLVRAVLAGILIGGGLAAMRRRWKR